MEPIETVSVFVDVEPKCEELKLEPGDFVADPERGPVQRCRLCLAPQAAVRLTRRDLAPFYCVFRPCGLGRDTMDSAHYSWVCQYCWVRACQCLKFIERARKTEHLLNYVFKNEPITEDKLSNIGQSHITPSVNLSVRALETYKTDYQTERRRKKRKFSTDETEEPPETEYSSIAINNVANDYDPINLDSINIASITSDHSDRVKTEPENVPAYDEVESHLELRGERKIAKKKSKVSKIKKKKNVKEKLRMMEQIGSRQQKNSKLKNMFTRNSMPHLRGHSLKLNPISMNSNPEKHVLGNRVVDSWNNQRARKDPEDLLARWRRLEVEVIKLSEAEQLAELERRRQSPRYLDWRHKCHLCAVGFHESVSLDRHNLSHHETRGAYECPICHVRFAKQHQLSSHSGGHRRRWRCLRCGETILKNDYLDAHRAKCTDSPPIRCDSCGKFFSNKLRLRQHVSSSHNVRRRHICDVCGREFKAKHHIRYHMRIHTGEMPYQCQLCGKKSSTSTSHRIHMTVHNKKTENPEAYCVECDKYFKNKNILQIHYQRSLKHNTKESFPHACSECEERYPAAAALRIHMNSAHLKTRSYQCSLCDKAYYSQGTLAVHVREKHVGRERSREHACSVCRRAFLTSSQLKAHTRIHTKERPYVCPLCPATFTFNSGLYTHTKNKHKMTTAELKSRLGLASLGTPQTQQQLLQRQLEQRPSPPPSRDQHDNTQHI